MNSNANALTFQSKTFDVVQRAGQVWLRAAEIADALGYARSDKVTEIYNRHQDEFTPAMTQTLKLRVKGFGAGNDKKEVRLFSLRGAHLIAMFSRTAVAKAFRVWVLDILDREVEGLRADAAKGHRLTDIQRHSLEALCSHMEFLHSWFKRIEPGLRLLNRRLAAAGHDHFIDGVSFARGLVRSQGLRSSSVYACGFPWDGDQHDRDMYRERAGKALA